MRYTLLTLLLLAANNFCHGVPITHLSGTQLLIGINVTVTPNNSPSSATLCNTGPYQIGKNAANSYTYTFATPVTHFVIQAIRFHNDDTMQILVNGTPYNFTGGSAFAGGTCNLTTNNMVYPGNGMVTTTGGATGAGQGVQLDLTMAPALINSVEVRHIRSAANTLASDIIYAADFRDDTCALDFNATVSMPICAGKDVQLSATLYPNTTYSWTTTAPPPVPTYAPSANVREPVLKAVSVTNTGTYTVTGTRGVCTYTANVSVPISSAPKIGNVIQTGPECVGADDTIKVPNINISTGGSVYAWGPAGLQQFSNVGYYLEFKNVQLASKGLYYVYAENVQGCISDTVQFNFDVLAGVGADFNYTVKEGCEEDEVTFINTSIDNNTQIWSFGDNTPNSTLKDPVHGYNVPKPNNAARTHTVTLIVANGNCADTVSKNIVLSHPLVADFTIDEDSICQGTIITFNNLAQVKPGTVPTFEWDLGFGDKTINPSITFTNEYNVAGMYRPELTVTDYLGCEAKYSLPLLVDSVGGITFSSDKKTVCVGDEVVFSGDYYATGANSITWDLADGETRDNVRKLAYSYTQPGTYDVSYSIDYRICPDLTVNAPIEVKPIPNIYLGEDKAICPNGDPLYIGDIANANNNKNIKYLWNTKTKDVTDGVYVRGPGVYALTADLDGCIATDSVVVKKNCYIDIPNAFTPNGDGKNDYFLPRQVLSSNLAEFSMQIYNRWGQQVFASDAINGRGWDGRYNGEEQATAVYIYTIQVTFGNGTHERYTGNVTLLR